MLGRFTVRWRYVLIAATFVFVAIAGSGMRFLTFTTDYRVFFSKHNPQLRAFETIQNTYTKYDNVMFVVAPKDGEVFNRRTLQAVLWLTHQAWQVPYSTRVDSLTNFQHTRANGDELIVGDLVPEDSPLLEREIEEFRRVALAEPLLRNRIVSERAHVTGVNVTVQLPGSDPISEVPKVADFARNLAQEFRSRYPGIDIYLTGIVMMNVSFPEASMRDNSTLVPLMFAVVIVTMLLMVRSVTGTLGAFLVIVFSIITALGLGGWVGMTLTGPSAAAPTIILTLAVADCVHILISFVQSMRRGMNKADAVVDSMRINLQPVFLTSVTTAVGFLSMNFSDVPPFRDLGNLVAVGVVFAFIYAALFLPAWVAALPVRAKSATTHASHAMSRFAEFVIGYRKWLLFVLGPVMLVLIAFIPRNELNDEFVKYFDKSIEFRRATDFSTANLTGIYTIQFSLQSGESGGIADPDFLARVERFAQWARGQPEVIHVNTITDTLKRLNRNLHRDDPAWYRVPADRELAAQYLLLYEMSLPYGLDLNDQINVDKSATRLIITTRNLSTRESIDLERRAHQWLVQNGTPPMSTTQGSSPNIMFAHIGKRNIVSMIGGTVTALIVISLILIVALRSVRIGLISMIPNLVPAALAFGLWGLLVGRVGLALSVVTAMTLGIVVDDTVHFLSKYTRARRELNLDAGNAVRYAFSTVGTALWVTSLVLIAGFMILAQSSFEVNSGMGLLTAITIAFALVADFLFLPPLLIFLAGDRPGAGTGPDRQLTAKNE